MPKLPRNLVRRPDRPGYHFRRKSHGKITWLALGTDYEEACRQLRSLKSLEQPSAGGITVLELAERWLATYVPAARNPKGVLLATRRVEPALETRARALSGEPDQARRPAALSAAA